MTYPASDGAQPPDCLVPLITDDEAPERMRAVFDRERGLGDHVRFLTRAVASSTATWQAATRAEQFFAVAKTLDVRTQTLVCLYTSLLNGCLYCIDDAAGAALETGLPVSELVALRNPKARELGEGTTARLVFTRWVVRAPDSIPPHIVDGLRAHADDEEILELTATVAMKCFWNHFASALRIPPEGRCQDEALLSTLSEISRGLRAGS
jgi:AhpD family alkylhydroperoxidase